MTIEDEKKKGGLSLFAKHAVQFYIVGASGVLVNLGILYLLTDIGGFWYVASQNNCNYSFNYNQFLFQQILDIW